MRAFIGIQGGRCLPGVVFCLVALITPLDTSRAQAPSGEGEVIRAHWPDVVYETQGAMNAPFVRAAEQYGDAELLPRVDSLGLGYAWSTEGDLPHVDFDLWWMRGEGGIVDGRIVPGDRMPERILLDLVDLHAEVHVDGRRVGDLLLTLDSLSLGPVPEVFSFETVDVTWSDVFASMDSTVAREAFTKGFTLEHLDILRVAFADVPAVESAGRDVPVVMRQPRRRTIFVPDVDIWIGWDLGPDPWLAPPRRIPRTYAPRGGTVGRTAGESRRPARDRGARRPNNGEEPKAERRSGDRPSIPVPKKGDDDDDDDDRDLLGPAAIGLAAVGILAVAGGTFGLQAHGDGSFGLFAGAIEPRWAFLVHAAVNADVLTKGDRERLRGGMLWTTRPIRSGFRPAFGGGVLLRERGDDIEVDPTVDLGVMVTAREMVLLLTVDVLTGSPRFGIGVNLKAMPER